MLITNSIFSLNSCIDRSFFGCSCSHSRVASALFPLLFAPVTLKIYAVNYQFSAANSVQLSFLKELLGFLVSYDIRGTVFCQLDPVLSRLPRDIREPHLDS